MGTPNIWSASGSTDGSLGTNYSLGSLSTTDILTYDATSAENVIMSAAMDCEQIISTTAFVSNWNQNGKTLTVSGAISLASDSSATTLTLNGTITQDADGNFTIGAWTTVSIASASFILQGTGTLNVGTRTITNLTCGAVGKVTTFTGGTLTLSNGLLTVGAGTLTVNNFIFLITSVSAALYSFNSSATLNGSSSIIVKAISAVTVTCPAVPSATSLYFRAENGSGTSTFNITGNITCTAFVTDLQQLGSVTYTTNGNQITVGSWTVANSFTGMLTINMGASATTVAGAFLINTANNVTLNLQTSTTNISRNFTLGTGVTVNSGTSTVTFNGATATALTLAGESLFDVVLNKTANGLTLADAFVCTGELRLTDGTFSMGGYAASVDDLIVNTADTKTFNGIMTVNGDATINQDTTFAEIKFTGTGTHTIAAGKTITISAFTATTWNNQSFVSGTPGVVALMVAPAGVVVTGCTFTDIDNSGGATIDASDPSNTVSASCVNITGPTSAPSDAQKYFFFFN